MQTFQIPPERCFESVEDLFAQSKLADSILISEFMEFPQSGSPEVVISLEASMESRFICFAAEDPSCEF